MIIRRTGGKKLGFGNLRFDRRAKVFPASTEEIDNMEVKVCSPAGDILRRTVAGGGAVGGGGERKFSHESEHDLALMVSDFLENNGSCGADSLCSSDNESGFSDLHHLADKISFFKRSVDQYESDLQSVVQSLLLSMDVKELQLVKSGLCYGSCIRYALVKLLRSSGYDAAVCASKWQGCNKVPGGDHEYIDVVNYLNDGSTERLIIDIDFRSHFEIARAVESYDKILKSLPVVFVGSLIKLKQFLQVMAEAARVSLKQNSMPLPPWRSLAYLLAKWHSPHQRMVVTLEEQNTNNSSTTITTHKQCNGHLRQLQSSLQSEIGTERLLKPIKSDTSRRLKLERRKISSFRTP
ncbi:hypothetical protein SOVF_109140 [Spinacia oleracea]|uniref:DUF506 domain-containing protein n=1 Tax=Spinacia oleracea TaxID=3562 RepID=A0A9R0K1Z2_SPIOL|nr:uncharacterized protein LOC110794830 [Spinacia oleracea]KNA14247.1 hypothetical protein SOVF_109140 [Spinacia oleracea]